MTFETHFSDRSRRLFGRYGYLPGYPKGRALVTISVDPPSIDAGQTGYVDVTLTGAKASPKCYAAFYPPDDLEAGLAHTRAEIISDDTARVWLVNTSDGTIDGAPRDWTAHLFAAAGV